MVTHIKIVAQEKTKVKQKESEKNIDSTVSFQTNTNKNKNKTYKCETVCMFTTRINNKKECDEKSTSHIQAKCGDNGGGGGCAAFSKRK